MGVKFGEIDVAQILKNEYRIGVLEKIVEVLLENSPAASSELDIDRIRRTVIEDLQQKYPQSGISVKD